MDRIVITEEDEIFLNEVREGLMKVGGEFEAKISMPGAFELLLEKQELLITFNQHESELQAKIEDVDGSKKYFMSRFTLDETLRASNFVYSEKITGQKQMESYVQTAAIEIAKVLSLFFYVLNNYKDYSIITEKEVSSNVVKASKAKKGKRPTKKVVRVVNKIIRISRDEEVQKSVKRSASRVWHVDEYGRRGHWREYKSGKRVWINAQTIKTGANTGKKDSKEYRL